MKDGVWVDIPGSVIKGNEKVELSVEFTAPVSIDAIRFYSTDAQVRIKELILR
jgi:hypothetical protein